METISALIAKTFDFVPIASHEPSVEVLTVPILSAAIARPATYEDEVFNFLLANRESLGIERVSDSRVSCSTVKSSLRISGDSPLR